MESPPTPRSLDSDELFAEPSKTNEDSKSSKDSTQSVDDAVNSSSSHKVYCIIKNGMYSGHLAKVTSENKKCGRFNMRLVSGLGHYCRRKDGTVMHTALARSSFDFLNISESMINESNTLDMVLKASGSAEANKVRQERLDLAEKLVFTVGSEYRIKPDSSGNIPTNSRPIPRPRPAARTSVDSSDGELDATKSNLYWVDCRPKKSAVDAPAAKKDPDGMESEDEPKESVVTFKIEETPTPPVLMGFPCLWYGENEEEPYVEEEQKANGGEGSTVGNSRDLVQVQPLALPALYAAGYRELLASLPSVEVSSSSSSSGSKGTAPTPATLTSSLPPSVESSTLYHHTTILKSVRRDQLVALDEEEVTTYVSTALFPLVSAYLRALLAFVEWAEFFKDSFHWPQFAAALFQSEECVSVWFDFVAQHSLLLPSSSSSSTGSSEATLSEAVANMKRTFLLLLCADHIGLLDQFTLVQWTEGEATYDIRRLMKSLSEMGNKEKPVYRSSSRVGGEYQSSVPLTVAGSSSTVVKDEEEVPSGGAAAAYSADAVDEAVIETYLGLVQLLQEKYLYVGQMVEVPINFADFSARFERYLINFEESKSVPSSAAGGGCCDSCGAEQYRKTRALHRFIEESRRSGSRVTTVAVVKHLDASSSSSSSSSGTGSGGGVEGASAATTAAAVPMEVTNDAVPNATNTYTTSDNSSSAAAAAVSYPPNLSLQNEEYIALRSNVRYCRFFNLEEDQCLEVLYAHGGDVSAALKQIENQLSAAAVSPCPASCAIATGPGRLSLEELKLFGNAVRIYPNNFNKACVKYYKSMNQQAHLFAPVEDSDSEDSDSTSTSSSSSNDEENEAEGNGSGSDNDGDGKSDSVSKKGIQENQAGSSSSSSSSESFTSCNPGSVDIKDSVEGDAAAPATTPADESRPKNDICAGESSSSDSSDAGSDGSSSSSSEESEEREPFKPELKSRTELLRMFFLFFPGWSEGRDRSGGNSGPAPVAVNAWTASSLGNRYGRNLQHSLDHSKFHASSTEFVNQSNLAMGGTGGGSFIDTTAATVDGKTPRSGPSSVSKAPLRPSGVSSNTLATTAVSGQTASIRRDPTIPNRWPSSLPLMSHNMYWLKTSNSPCLCVGLDENSLRSSGDGLLTIITVCCATYHHAVSVPASKLEPLDEDIVKQCSDERAVGFALAMMDFAEYELQSLPLDSFLRRWYIFPAFIRKFLHNMQVFASWRKQVERANRDTKADRRKVYYNGLVETYNANLAEEMKDIRLLSTSYPWDDTPVSDSEEDEEDEEEEVGSGSDSEAVNEEGESISTAAVAAAPSSSGRKSGGGSRKPHLSSRASTSSNLTAAEERGTKSERPLWQRGQKRKLEASGIADRNESATSFDNTVHSLLNGKITSNVPSTADANEHNEEDEDDDVKSVSGIGSSTLFNLFWVSKSKLPCLYFDEPIRENPDKIRVLPICCSTYHYPVEVVPSYFEPLRVELLRQCTDDRTHDFTLALIEFAKWDCSLTKKGTPFPFPVARVENDENQSISSADEDDARSAAPAVVRVPREQHPDFYLWPTFLTRMLNKPKEWAVWRKKVERSSVGRPGARPFFYFEQLKADYLADVTVSRGDGEGGEGTTGERMEI